ncbi:hypothetical protein GUITHDRAFT_137350 [Guillardia theta CCMP2712]|uniref:Uncharacterized protein n=1 Tax=Guillardia theta (strain CCMP2712) TaxID=905079 RepID=L1JGE7_GUITC|nr:hypothetical protein GUITHDRAFT_137350 [Guillardia theta CCMP2712]EKX47571.1 hypothetical protein GUITHDRAFT_137350 [Guillardia theta CCMP2712]|eukprot:XP_005834551.1 hypothetical protein GUITHDRAFT_137350 [Guillardia theta CCMP2712]
MVLCSGVWMNGLRTFPAEVKRSFDESEGSDLFYRLKDRMTNTIRTPYDKQDSSKDKACWPIGTRVVITEDGDMYLNHVGRLVEYRGKGWYAVFMEDGHKVCYNPMQFARCADQSGPPTSSQMYVDPFTQGNKRFLNDPHFVQHGMVDGFRLLQANNSNNQGGCNGSSSNSHHAQNGSNPPLGTKVRIVRTYGGSLLPRDEVKTGETTGFVHGWYTITLDETNKTTNCRRSSFVIVGDDEDVALGYAEEKQEGKGSTKKVGGDDGKGGDSESVLSGQEENDRSSLHKSTRKRGRPSQKEQIERARVPQPESNQRDASEDGDEDDEGDEGDKRRKGKRIDEEATNGRRKRVKSRDDAEKESKDSKDGKDEEETKREEMSEERRRKEDKDKERKEEDVKQEPQLTQEERDALEAARLAAMLNRNPRRRGAERDIEIHLPLPRVPHKSRKKKEDKDEKHHGKEEKNEHGDSKA